MQKLFRTTTLQDAFGCGPFNILIAGMPRVMGVRGSCRSGPRRTECKRRSIFRRTKRRTSCTCSGASAGSLPISYRAIAIIRETEAGCRGRPGTMIGFVGIDQIQAEYVAEISCENINKGIHPEPPEVRRSSLERRSPSFRSDARLRKEGAGAHLQGARAGRAEIRQRGAQRPPSSTTTTAAGARTTSRKTRLLPSPSLLSPQRGYFKHHHGAVAAQTGEQNSRRATAASYPAPRRTAAKCSSSPTNIRPLQDPHLRICRRQWLPRFRRLPARRSLGSTRARGFLTAVFPEKYGVNCLFVFENWQQRRPKIAASCCRLRSSTASGSPAPTRQEPGQGDHRTCRRRNRSSSRLGWPRASPSPRPNSPSRPPVRRRAWP